MRAGLRDEADRSGFAGRLLTGLANAQLGVVNAHAVRSDQRQAGFACDLAQLSLQRGRFLLARLREARREQRDACHLAGGAVSDDARRDLAWHSAKDVVDVSRDVRQRREVLHAHLLDARDLVRVDLDGVDVAGKVLHVAQPHVAIHALVANNDDRLWVQRPCEIGRQV